MPAVNRPTPAIVTQTAVRPLPRLALLLFWHEGTPLISLPQLLVEAHAAAAHGPCPEAPHVVRNRAATVRHFVELIGRDQAIDLLGTTVVAAIGPVTAEAASQM